MKSGNVLEVFSQTAGLFGDRVAVEHRGRRFSYETVERDADRLANFLNAHGARKGALVAVLVDDPTRVITSVLAVLKAGCVFVPFDTATPDKRLSALCAEVSPEWFITESGLLGRVAAVAHACGLGVKAVCLDDDAADPVGAAAVNVVRGFGDYTDASPVAAERAPDDVCYVYFTSGSTGKPKGIAGRLKGIDHFIRWEAKTFNVGAGTRVSQLTSPSFDAYLRDVFTPLCAGGTVCIPDSREAIVDARLLIDWIAREGVNLIHCVPSLLRSILNERPEAERFEALQTVLLSGEPLLPADVGRWFDIFGPRVRLVNLYGPTETTMTKFFYVVEPDDRRRQRIPIGKPMEGARALVVDDRGRACGANAIGEIYIRTPYRSHGYLGRPELTSEVFVANPFGADPLDLVYKTGDLGRMLEDGNFEFLGRRDEQVKIRGARVELAEIQNCLRGHEAVRDVAVIDLEDAGAGKYLCAYVVTDGALETDALRGYLRESLPEYMVPTAYVSIKSLPRTVSGKIDRRALPSPAEHATRQLAPYVAPTGQVEEKLAALWREVLGLERAGADDNFFEAGGHSLLATQLLSRVRASFGVAVALRDLFENPTVRGLAAAVGQSAKVARELPIVPFERAPGVNVLPLSFAQQRLWFLHQLQPDSSFYHLSLKFGLHGALNPAALEQSINEIVRRHEILRTTFSNAGGRPAQVISPAADAPLSFHDISSAPTAEQLAQESRLTNEVTQLPFNLERGPLWRVLLLRRGPEHHVLLLAMHHIISDAWSLKVLWNELTALYEAHAGGGGSPLPALPLQYADYSEWQRKWFEGAALEEQLTYWKGKLAGLPALSSLPTDRARMAVQQYHGAQLSRVFSPRLSRQLKTFARGRGVTLFITMLAAFKSLLYRYTGQEDVVVGTSLANRNRVETEGLVGFFANTVVLRTSLSGNPRFDEALRRVRDTTLEAQSHQDLPFERLVEEMRPERSLSHSSLLQIMFVMQNVGGESAQLSGLEMRAERVAHATAKFDLTLFANETEDGLELSCVYNSDLFDETQMRRFILHYERLLEDAVADPRRRLARLRLLDDAERAAALSGGNETRRDYGPAACVHELFERQAERTPDAVAVVSDDGRLTYRELSLSSSRIARYLQSLGVTAETRVGLLLPRSAGAVAAMLGVLKAGGAYVPLDEAHPPERLRLMLRDCGATVLLGRRDALEHLAPEFQMTLGCLEDASEARDWPDEANAGGLAAAENLAYVIYTSGSTGKPKGVAVEHRQLSNYLQAVTERCGFAAGESYATVSTPAADLGYTMVWPALCLGGTLHVVSETLSSDAASLADYFSRHEIDNLKIVPSHLAALLAGAKGARVVPRKRLVLGGERAHWQLIERVSTLNPRCEIYNHYGPTETTVGVLATRAPHAAEAERGANPPLGKPLGNVRAYILDAQMQPVPAGAVGEIYVGGANVARGYINAPSLTAERFAPDPFGPASGGRLYRTGDIARARADGQVEFIARRDTQLKVNGYRVELGEIEAALREQEGLRECVVAWVQDAEDAGGRLVAYVVGEGGAALPQDEILRGLRKRLPAYMLPAQVVSLESLPLTPNGKPDRRALPAPPARASSAPPSPPMQTHTERTITRIWQEVLRRDSVGIHDNFFELGGNSMLLIQMHSRLRDSIETEVPVGELFQYTTISSLASRLSREHVEDASESETLERVASRRALLNRSRAGRQLHAQAETPEENPYE